MKRGSECVQRGSFLCAVSGLQSDVSRVWFNCGRAGAATGGLMAEFLCVQIYWALRDCFHRAAYIERETDPKSTLNECTCAIMP